MAYDQAMATRETSEFFSILKPGTPLLGLDVGEKTIGLALSDVGLCIASPQETIARTSFGKDWLKLESLINARGVQGLVIGYPINMNGTEGPRCQSIRQFARHVEAKRTIPILLHDERMSTDAVTRTIEEADLSRRRRDALVDKLAAAYILQGLLDQWQRISRQTMDTV